MTGQHTDSGVCLCHGIYVEGPRQQSRPEPYRALTLFGGANALVVMVVSNGQSHEIPAPKGSKG